MVKILSLKDRISIKLQIIYILKVTVLYTVFFYQEVFLDTIITLFMD